MKKKTEKANMFLVQLFGHRVRERIKGNIDGRRKMSRKRERRN